VLAILALASPRAVPRVRITSLLWSLREREQARGSLRQCVHEIQGLLQGLGPGILEADREQLRLVEDAFWLDVRETKPLPNTSLVEDLVGIDPAFDVWLRSEAPRPETPAVQPVERGPRIAIRRPRVMGGPAEAALADGLSEELAAALSRFRWMAAIAPGTTEPGAEAAAEYLLDGTVRRQGEQLRATLRVQDTRAGGEVIWARTFDGTAEDLFGFQDEIVAQTAAQVDPELLLREGARAATLVAAGARSALSLTLAAVPAIVRLERGGFELAGRMLEEAIAIAPDNAMAHCWLAYWHIMAMGQGWEHDSGDAMGRAAELAQRAIMLDPSDGRALTVAGHFRGFIRKQTEEAIVLHDRAIALNPSLTWAWMTSGLAHSYQGEHREAIRRIDIARRLSPFDPHAFFFAVSLMLPHLMIGDYERAMELGRLTAQLKPNFSSSWKGLLVALGYLGRTEEAATVRGRLQELEPGFTVSEAIRRSPLRRAEDRERFAEGMRRGGLPE
jgi:TolB-like protein